MGDADSFEGFVEVARATVEAEARENAEDRWWVLAPTLLVARPSGLRRAPLVPGLANRPIGRALIAGDPALLLEALGARRCAIALHVDLEIEGEILPAIVLAVLGRMATALMYAPVLRTDYGTPRLGPWRPGALGVEELFAAVRRTLASGT